MSELQNLTLAVLEDAVGGTAAAIRSVTRLQPAGGMGDKVFPPTYAQDDKTALKYAMETRRIDELKKETVLLDSVASQANRMEEALLASWSTGKLHFPVIAVDFTGEEGIKDLDRITTLQAPHRIADALFRDSITNEGILFRDTEAGRAFTEATVRNATAVYRYCPTALIFGVWDSTGPKGGLGNKFQRALVSEIVGIGAVTGTKTSSRIDPAGVQANVNVYERADNKNDWTIDEKEARKEKGNPVLFSRKGSEGKGKPSAINHSNIKPLIDVTAGGVTIEYAIQTTVLSLPALRRLHFPTDVKGNRLDGEKRIKGEHAARTALAALSLAAVALHRAQGFDLRSRSLLVPDPGGPMTLEVVPSDGGKSPSYTLTPGQAKGLLREAHENAARTGFEWEREPLKLKPAPKLADLIRKSRELAAEGEVADDGTH